MIPDPRVSPSEAIKSQRLEMSIESVVYHNRVPEYRKNGPGVYAAPRLMKTKGTYCVADSFRATKPIS
jgi:hypothetical protein